MSAVHPIEVESYRILGERVDLGHLGPGPAAVVARVVHATADLDYVRSIVADDEAVAAGVAAVAAGAPVVADVEMVRAGITGVAARCYLAEAVASPDGALTRSAAAMRLAAECHPRGAVVVVGCAPTALVEAVELALAGRWQPALVVGVPVGFVGAAESKELLRRSGLPAVSNVGEKGGSPVAAAVVNALVRLARSRGEVT